MKIITVTSLEQAGMEVIKIIPKEKEINIAITGGNFGNHFLGSLISSKVDLKNWEIFITDERITKEREEQNSFNLHRNLSKIAGFTLEKFNPFNQSENDAMCYLDLNRKLMHRKANFLDFCLLSLGEDGHLAGHFFNSKDAIDEKFCYTVDAPIGPSRRISFTMTWLMQSGLIVLAVMGNSKRTALYELITGKGTHADLWGRQNLILITDLDIDGLKNSSR